MRSRGSQAFAGADWRHPAAGWQQWGERSRWAVAVVNGQPGFAQLLRKPLELPDHVAASIELTQFVAADVDSLA